MAAAGIVGFARRGGFRKVDAPGGGRCADAAENVAKALNGGYVPCAAFVTAREIHQNSFSSLDRRVIHSTTFGRNNLATAAGLAAIHVLESEGMVENCAKMGAPACRILPARNRRCCGSQNFRESRALTPSFAKRCEGDGRQPQQHRAVGRLRNVECNGVRAKIVVDI